MMHHTKASSKFEENIITNTNKNDRENDTRAQDNVAANSTEAKISEGDILLQTGKIVRDWESVHHRSLKGKNKDIALKAAYIQLTQKRGIIRSDLYKCYNSDYARRKIYLLQKDLGLLVPINDRRSGRFQQYCISTELDRFKEESHASSSTNSDSAVKQGEKIGADQSMQTSSTSLIQHLVAALSRKKPTFHKLHLYTKLPPELYGDIDWSVPSTRNKAKVKEFPLEYRRSVGFEIFSDGTTGIHMTSTSNPYELHTPLGIIEFVSSLGEARSILKAECKDLRQIPPVAKWRLKMFDKDKTISLSELEKDIPQVMKWWSAEGIRVEHLGYAFQIYGKVMPETGPAFRLEVQSTVEDKEKDLSEAILEATFPEVKFKTAFELLNRRVERLEDNNNNP
jgi:hypothetical protein